MVTPLYNNNDLIVYLRMIIFSSIVSSKLYCRTWERSHVNLMLPKHRSECDLERPFQRAYFENEFGNRSIGEPNWKPHLRNALDFPDCQEHSVK